MTRQWRIGIDVGGTFTDAVVLDDKGTVVGAKSPSIPSSLGDSVLNAIRKAGEAVEVPLDELLANAQIVHGTTLGLNTLLTRSGVETGLLTNDGFRDLIDMRLGFKERRYGFSMVKPEPLVERSLRIGVGGRVRSDGKVVEPLDVDAIAHACEVFIERGVRAVAISFLWSFLNPEHERQAAELCRTLMPEGTFISCSTDVVSEIREYDRTGTTIVNAYIGPIVNDYVTSLETLLRGAGYDGDVLYLQSSGGLTFSEEIKRLPVKTLMSGPAAAPAASRYFAEKLSVDNVLSFDMGGTSLDLTLLVNGEVSRSRPSELEGHRIGIQTVDVRSIAGGGGSIAHESLGLLQVGPESAGAIPGPAAYGHGGRSTVTDSDLALGIYAPGPISGGVELSLSAAQSALSALGHSLDLDMQTVAIGVQQVLALDYTQAVREISLTQGRDPRESVLLVGGGGGGSHWHPVAQELQISTVLVPKSSGLLCAIGAVLSDVTLGLRRSIPAAVDRHGQAEALLREFRSLQREVTDRLGPGAEEASDGEVSYVWFADMRYQDQVWELEIPVEPEELAAGSLEPLYARFDRMHEARFHHANPSLEREIVTIGVHGIIKAGVELRFDSQEHQRLSAPQPIEEREVTLVTGAGAAGPPSPVPFYEGRDFPVGRELAGPAILREPDCSVVVPEDWTCTLMPWGAYVLRHVPGA